MQPASRVTYKIYQTYQKVRQSSSSFSQLALAQTRRKNVRFEIQISKMLEIPPRSSRDAAGPRVLVACACDSTECVVVRGRWWNIHFLRGGVARRDGMRVC